MIVVIKSRTPPEEIERVSQEICSCNITPEKYVAHHKVAIGLVGKTTAINTQQIQIV